VRYAGLYNILAATVHASLSSRLPTHSLFLPAGAGVFYNILSGNQTLTERCGVLGWILNILVHLESIKLSVQSKLRLSI